ncbi:MAG: AtpZ/AtpI family protein [Candidatus Binatia bacterium]
MANAGGRPDSRKDNQTFFLRKAGVVVAIAFELPGAILGGLFMGYLLDNYFNTSPWLMMVLTIIAIAGASMRLVQWMRFLSDKSNEPDVPRRDHSAH